MRLGKLRYESKYLAIKYFYDERRWSISWMCRQLGIARASYYKWLHRDTPWQEQENVKIAELVREYDERFGHILGYRRMADWINHFNGTQYSRNRIHRIMKKLGIHSVIRRKKKKYLSSTPAVTAENRLKRDFHADNVNQKWATDVTEFKIPGSNRKLYLSAILDLYDRSVVSWQLSHANNNDLVFKTFDQAVEENPEARPVFHSDRGFQYTSRAFHFRLQEQGMDQSMSRVGRCIDNGPVEGFWGTIKAEMYHMYTIEDEQSLRDAIGKYINFYNNARPQGRYGCKTPSEVRREAMETSTPTDYPIPENKRIQDCKKQWAA